VAFEKATTNASGIKAEIVINYSDGRGFDQKSIKVKKGDDLYAKSNEIAAYRTGFKIKTIDATPGSEYLELANGTRLKLGESIGGISDDIWKAQIDLTVEMHFKKEQTYGKLGVKILSLFFIDKVANYRGSPFDPSIKGKVALWFEESFKKCVVRVNQKEFDKIAALPSVYLGHENTTLEGRKSCAVVCPREEIPNVLKFAKLWKPKCTSDQWKSFDKVLHWINEQDDKMISKGDLYDAVMSMRPE
jgi:type III restriction enzyme